MPDETLAIEAWSTEPPVACSTTEIFCQVPDWGHLKFMHAGTMQTTEDSQNATPEFAFEKFNFGYSVKSMNFAGAQREKEGGQEFPAVKIYVFGTSIIRIETYVNGVWAGVIGTAVMRAPGKTQIMGAVAVKKGDGSPESESAVREQIEFHKRQVQVTGDEDMVIYENIRFAPGALTPIDSIVSQDSHQMLSTILAYGQKDKLRPGAEYFSGLLPESHTFTNDGGHGWNTWTPLWSDITKSEIWENLDGEK